MPSGTFGWDAGSLKSSNWFRLCISYCLEKLLNQHEDWKVFGKENQVLTCHFFMLKEKY